MYVRFARAEEGASKRTVRRRGYRVYSLAEDSPGPAQQGRGGEEGRAGPERA